MLTFRALALPQSDWLTLETRSGTTFPDGHGPLINFNWQPRIRRESSGIEGKHKTFQQLIFEKTTRKNDARRTNGNGYLTGIHFEPLSHTHRNKRVAICSARAQGKPTPTLAILYLTEGPVSPTQLHDGHQRNTDDRRHRHDPANRLSPRGIQIAVVVVQRLIRHQAEDEDGLKWRRNPGQANQSRFYNKGDQPSIPIGFQSLSIIVQTHG